MIGSQCRDEDGCRKFIRVCGDKVSAQNVYRIEGDEVEIKEDIEEGYRRTEETGGSAKLGNVYTMTINLLYIDNYICTETTVQLPTNRNTTSHSPPASREILRTQQSTLDASNL